MEKRRVRAGHRTHVSRIIERAKLAIAESDRTKINYLKSLAETLEDKQVLLKELDDQILLACKEDEIDKEIEESGELAITIKHVLLDVASALSAWEPSHDTGDLEGSESSSTHSTSTKSRVKLPKITIKNFNGEPTEWQMFWDSFKSAVDENQDLSEIDKFNYLLGFLEGNAQNCLTGLALSGQNYKEAVKILTERYGNKQLIISRHMDLLLQTPMVRSSTDVSGLREMYDKIEANVRSLQSLGINSEHYGSLLAPIVMNKIPDDLKLVISRKMPEDVWELDSVIGALKSEIQVREKCTFVRKVSPEPPKKKRHNNERRDKPLTASYLLSGADEGGSNASPSITCTYCLQQHRSTKCTVVTDVKARKSILRNKGRCFLCLKSNHVSKDCRSGRPCYHCGGYHHISICPKKGSGLPAAVQAHTDQQTESPSTESTSANVAAQRNKKSGKAVLLQTAYSTVSGVNNGEKKAKARILFDSGSQRSYISEKLRNALSLKADKSETLVIKAFGDSKEQVKVCDLVQVAVEGLDGQTSTYLTAHVVPSICAPINGQVVDYASNNYKHLKGLRLADSTTGLEGVEIDLLVGCDFYWNFMTSIVRRGKPGSPVATYTKLGWVLSGPTEVPGNCSASINLNSTHVLRVNTEVLENTSDLKSQLNRFWDLEGIGILPNEPDVYDDLKESIVFTGERYQVALPWKEDHEQLPDNYHLSLQRLDSLLKRLRRNPELLEKYDQVIKEQLAAGIIETVDLDKESSTVTPGGVHYIPHRAVVREDKSSTKVRVGL